MQSNIHPSLKPLALDCREWIERAELDGKYERFTAAVQDYIDIPGPLHAKTGLHLDSLAHYYDVASCDAFLRGDRPMLSHALQRAASLRALMLRWDGMYSHMRQDLGNWPREFKYGMRAASPAMFSWWDRAEICARLFIEMAEKDQRINTMREMRRIKRGTSDAFLIGLFSQAFNIETDFIAPKPLVPSYQALLEHWQSEDEATFTTVMQDAADFHISRCKENTDRERYEFDATLDRCFPAELLAVQALRRRNGLPEFSVGHLLIDTPWSLVQEMKSVERYALADTVEDRLIQDYPEFR
ncbi:hypothetical protein [Pseudomonas caspiana]|uniref:hypothetical protein n=1 Tax=Pseudomonas caspiana TaxID=1451454 RepID=UPI0032ECE639